MIYIVYHDGQLRISNAPSGHVIATMPPAVYQAMLKRYGRPG